MKNRQKILIALFSALVLLTAVTLTGCFGDEEGDLRLLCGECHGEEL